jgi:predicted transposase YbfD/YdcC
LPELRSIVLLALESCFKATARLESETQYYISTLRNVCLIEKRIRKHWGKENKVHWILVVAFNKDMSQKRNGEVAQIFSSLNRIALNLLRKNKLRIEGKRTLKMCGWNNDYILKNLKN